MSSDDKNENSGGKAYITADGRYIDPADATVHEELKKPRQVSKKEPETVKPQKKVSEKKDSEYSKARKKQLESSHADSESSDDLFDEDGNIFEEESQAKQKLKELEEKVEQGLNRLKELIATKIKKPLLKVKAKALGFLSKFLNPLTFVITRFTDIIEKVVKRTKANEPDKEIRETPVEKNLVHGTFENMTTLNITFTDNYDIALYKKRGVALAKSEENLILLSAKDAIVQCAEYTLEMPDVQEGMYAGRKVSDLMTNVTEEDIMLFLGYVKERPQKYISKSWKISETYATWLVNNSPVIEE